MRNLKWAGRVAIVSMNVMVASKSRRTATLWEIAFSCVVCLSLMPQAWALPVARLRGVKPVVEIQNQSAKKGQNAKFPAWKLARERSALVFNDTVRTGPRGGAELLFNNGTRIALKANSQLQILAPPDDSHPLAVRVFGALSEIFVRAKGPTEIRTAAGTAAVRGTQYLVRLDEENRTRVTVTEGTVAFFNPQGEVLVHSGEESSAVVGQAPTPPVAVDASGLLQWTFDVTALPIPFELNTGTAPNAALTQAATALQAGDIQTALPLLREVTEQNPALFQAQSLLSLALLQQNDISGARRTAQRAVDSAPQSALARSTLSLALFFGGQSAQARRQATQALSLDPLSPLALLAYSRAQTTLGQTDEARQALEQAAVLAPEFPLIQRDLGALYLSIDRLPQAEAAFNRVLAVTRDDGIALAGLGTVLSRTGREEQAQTTFDAAIGAAPRNALVRAQLAAYLIDAGQLERAREVTEAFLREQNLIEEDGSLSTTNLGAGRPELGAIFIRFSEEALYRQNLTQAFEYGQRSVQLLPASAPAHYQWGRVLLEQERTTQAQAQFRLAVTLDPRNARARYALGMTQELAASGRDVTRVLGTADAAREGGPSQGLSLRDLQSPGAAQRIQAALQDPTVVRTATRSYGDTQISGALGRGVGDAPGAGTSGRRAIRTGDVSILKEFAERRGVWGFNASTDHADGVRRNADTGSDRASVSFGLKAKDNPSGLFALGQWDTRKSGISTGRLVTDVDGRNRVRKPQLLIGFNWQPTEKASTRVLLSAQKPEFRTLITSQLGGDTSTTSSSNALSSLHGEARHERRLGQNQWLSVGASWGFRSATSDRLSIFPDQTITGQSETAIRNQVIYVRDEYQATPRLTLTGEIKAVRIDVENRGVTVFDPPLPFPPPNGTTRSVTRQTDNGFTGLPTFLSTYQLGASTSARFRVRRLMGGVDDFELLSPRDVFLFSSLEVPYLNFGQRGRSYEAELNHTFPNAAFLQLGVFQQSGQGSVSDLEKFISQRFRGVRARYEGLLSQRSTFFVSGDYNAGRGTADSFGIVPLASNLLSEVPRVRVEMGLQYLGVRGFFVQPTVGYFGEVLQADDFDAPRVRRSSFTLANLRIGKRRGLRQVVYVEGRNLFNKNYAVTSQTDVNGNLGMGRQIVVGFSRRF